MKKEGKAMKENIQFEFYVLNYDFNCRKVINFNVFSNYKVNEWALKAVKKHLRSRKKYPFEEFKNDIKSHIMNQEWARYEYEISVGKPFADDCKSLEKWDCWGQCEPNLDIICHELIRQYKEQTKKTD